MVQPVLESAWNSSWKKQEMEKLLRCWEESASVSQKSILKYLLIAISIADFSIHCSSPQALRGQGYSLNIIQVENKLASTSY